MKPARIIAALLVILFPACVIGPKTSADAAAKYPVSITPCKDCKTSEISGTVIDAKDNEPLIGGTVVINNMKGEFVMGSNIDLEGRFKIKQIPHGTYMLRAECPGSQAFSTGPLKLDSVSARIEIKMELKSGQLEWGPPPHKPVLIIKNDPNNRTIDREQIRRMPK